MESGLSWCVRFHHIIESNAKEHIGLKNMLGRIVDTTESGVVNRLYQLTGLLGCTYSAACRPIPRFNTCKVQRIST